jgi:ceramide glucosyltransferase
LTGTTSLLVPLVVLLGSLAALGLVVTWSSDRALRIVLDAPVPPTGSSPPVTLLKPVKGVDEGLYENLASFARLDYPRFELLVGAVDPDDPALAVAWAVARDFPGLDLRVVVCPDTGALNPKVNLLTTLERHARYDHLLISDSNVRVTPDYLRTIVDELERPGVGLVTNVVVGVGEQSLGARLDNLHLATYVARATITAHVRLGHACVVGKSMLFRRADLRRIGGFAPVRDVLAEDYVLGQRFQRAGLAVRVSPRPVHTVSTDGSLARFANRHLRWTQMRRRVSLGAYFSEPFVSPTPLLLAFGAVAALGRPEGWPGAVAAALAGLVARLASDAALLRRLRPGRTTAGSLLLLPVKDVLCLGLWLLAGVRRRICWRGTCLRIGRGSRLEPIGRAAPRPPVHVPSAAAWEVNRDVA